MAYKTLTARINSLYAIVLAPHKETEAGLAQSQLQGSITITCHRTTGTGIHFCILCTALIVHLFLGHKNKTTAQAHSNNSTSF